ncbi:SGNH/GDSL hydrolase family protein [Acidisphaera sp. S103]|uniref:SGNH/GDSL hydrolase family protein n=1 Tax=Acidisphaera sp. S103 TaxID=1747223 RepID=UPI00131C2B4E|nr:SGNH/GDSL hydrolase family protein [Acidisphaera sp. S103]
MPPSPSPIPALPVPSGRLSNRIGWRPGQSYSSSIAGGTNGATISQLIHMEAGFTWVCLELIMHTAAGSNPSYTIPAMSVSPTSAFNDGFTPVDMTGAVNQTLWKQVTFNNLENGGNGYVEFTSQRAPVPTGATIVSGGTGYLNGGSGTNVPVLVDGCVGGTPIVLFATISSGVITAITGVDPGAGNNVSYLPPNPVTLVGAGFVGSNASVDLIAGSASSVTISGSSWSAANSYDAHLGTVVYSDWIPVGSAQQGFYALDGQPGAYLLIRGDVPANITSYAACGTGLVTLTSATIDVAGGGYLGGGSGQLEVPVIINNAAQPGAVVVNVTNGVPQSVDHIVYGGAYSGYSGNATFTAAATTSAIVTATSSGSVLAVTEVTQGFVQPDLWVQGASVPTQILPGDTGNGGVGTYNLTASPNALSGPLTLSTDPAGTGLTISGALNMSDIQKSYAPGQSPTTARRWFGCRTFNGQYAAAGTQAGMTSITGGTVQAGGFAGIVAGVIALGQTRGFTVMEFGDSLTQGVGSDAYVNGACALACRALSTPQRPVSYINNSKLSSQSETFVERFFQSIAAYKPNCIVAEIMSPNDINDGSYTTATVDDSIRNCWTIIQWGIDNDVPVIIQGPTCQPTKYSIAQDGFRLAARALAQRMAAQGMVLYWDWPNIVGDASSPQKYQAWTATPDFIHPGQPGQIALGLGLPAAGQGAPSSWPLATNATLPSAAGNVSVPVSVQPLISLLQRVLGEPGVYQ